MTPKQNIIVIMTDQHCADAMSNCGNPDLHTPNLDRLASEGTRFDRAYCSFPLCNPSRASMVSGKWPHVLGTMGNDTAMRPEDVAQTVGPLMRQAGYRSGWAGKWHVPHMDLGEDAESFGFENVCGFSDRYLVPACDGFLRQEHTRPFLLFASFDNPHNICEHTRDQLLPWGEVESPDDDPSDYPNLPLNHAAPAFEARVLSQVRKALPPNQFGYTQERWRRYRHVYYRLCERVDAQIGQLLKALDDTGLARNTVVIMLADHGDHNGAHGLVYKSTSYEESARVPFIVRQPGVNAGQTRDAFVNTGLDLLPTILDFAGVEIPDDLEGRSVRPLIGGSEKNDKVDACFLEGVVDTTNIELRMVRTGRYKHTVYDRGQYREMLFDLEIDPGELRNLAVERRYLDVLNDHRRRLHEWCVRTGDNFAKHYSHDVYPIVPGEGYLSAPPRQTFEIPDAKSES